MKTVQENPAPFRPLMAIAMAPGLQPLGMESNSGITWIALLPPSNPPLDKTDFDRHMEYLPFQQLHIIDMSLYGPCTPDLLCLSALAPLRTRKVRDTMPRDCVGSTWPMANSASGHGGTQLGWKDISSGRYPAHDRLLRSPRPLLARERTLP
jgi:hypothetical protein